MSPIALRILFLLAFVQLLVIATTDCKWRWDCGNNKGVEELCKWTYDCENSTTTTGSSTGMHGGGSSSGGNGGTGGNSTNDDTDVDAQYNNCGWMWLCDELMEGRRCGWQWMCSPGALALNATCSTSSNNSTNTKVDHSHCGWRLACLGDGRLGFGDCVWHWHCCDNDLDDQTDFCLQLQCRTQVFFRGHTTFVETTTTTPSIPALSSSTSHPSVSGGHNNSTNNSTNNNNNSTNNNNNNNNNHMMEEIIYARVLEITTCEWLPCPLHTLPTQRCGWRLFCEMEESRLWKGTRVECEWYWACMKIPTSSSSSTGSQGGGTGTTGTTGTTGGGTGTTGGGTGTTGTTGTTGGGSTALGGGGPGTGGGSSTGIVGGGGSSTGGGVTGGMTGSTGGMTGDMAGTMSQFSADVSGDTPLCGWRWECPQGNIPFGVNTGCDFAWYCSVLAVDVIDLSVNLTINSTTAGCAYRYLCTLNDTDMGSSPNTTTTNNSTTTNTNSNSNATVCNWDWYCQNNTSTATGGTGGTGGGTGVTGGTGGSTIGGTGPFMSTGTTGRHNTSDATAIGIGMGVIGIPLLMSLFNI